MTEPAAPAAPEAPRTKGGRFTKGNSGNPKGRKVELPEVRALIVDGLPVAVRYLLKLVDDKGAADKDRAAAAKTLLEFGIAKPRDVTEVGDMAAAMRALADALTTD